MAVIQFQAQQALGNCKELRRLDGLTDGQRGAAFLCKLADTKQRRSLWLNTSAVPQAALSSSRTYDRPFAPFCRCTTTHVFFVGSQRVQILFFGIVWRPVLGCVSGFDFAAQKTRTKSEPSLGSSSGRTWSLSPSSLSQALSCFRTWQSCVGAGSHTFHTLALLD